MRCGCSGLYTASERGGVVFCKRGILNGRGLHMYQVCIEHRTPLHMGQGILMCFMVTSPNEMRMRTKMNGKVGLI